jgi:hypothetical protein
LFSFHLFFIFISLPRIEKRPLSYIYLLCRFMSQVRAWEKSCQTLSSLASTGAFNCAPSVQAALPHWARY